MVVAFDLVARELFVRELKISRPTADKILTVHGLHEDEVKATVEDQGAWVFSWHYDQERGWRAILEGVVIREMACYVVLYPAEGNTVGSGAWEAPTPTRRLNPRNERMMAMDDDDFYEDDEPIEKIRADFAAGEKGVTVSRLDLNQRAASIVAQIAADSEEEPESSIPEPAVFDASTWFLVPGASRRVLSQEEEKPTTRVRRLPLSV